MPVYKVGDRVVVVDRSRYHPGARAHLAFSPELPLDRVCALLTAFAEALHPRDADWSCSVVETKQVSHVSVNDEEDLENG
jgi:hypothetical protein